jgi:hypothetical protein
MAGNQEEQVEENRIKFFFEEQQISVDERWK